jgi:hypothetical protein
MAARMAMMAITTSSSINVNAFFMEIPFVLHGGLDSRHSRSASGQTTRILLSIIGESIPPLGCQENQTCALFRSNNLDDFKREYD